MTEQDYIIAVYLVHGVGGFAKKAQDIARGLTVGTWTELPESTKKRLEKHLGKVFGVKEMDPDDSGAPRAVITIGYPVVNVTPDLPAILTTVFGKLSMDGQIKLIDLQLPDSYLSLFPGPRFGIDGLRKILNVGDRPLLMSIFKQCIGLTLPELEEEYEKQISGGVDLVKDDEIFFRDDAAPVLERIRTLERLNREQEEKLGKKVLYAVNLTGPVTELVERAKRFASAGASCLLLNAIPYGLDVLHRLAADPDVQIPIMVHPAFSGTLYPSIHYGVAAPLLLGKLMRWLGADMVLFPSPYGSVAMGRTDARDVAQCLRQTSAFHQPAFPVPSAGIYPGLVPFLYRDFGKDSIVNAGGGIHGHPLGASAGGKAFLDAIHAAIAGCPLTEAAKQSLELRLAIEKWGVDQA